MTARPADGDAGGSRSHRKLAAIMKRHGGRGIPP